MGIPTRTSYLEEIHSIVPLETEIVVCLAEIETSCLSALSDPQFECLKSRLGRRRHIVWVTTLKVGKSSYPEHSLSSGLFRVARPEAVEKRDIVMLAVEGSGVNDHDPLLIAEYIHKVLQSVFESVLTD